MKPNRRFTLTNIRSSHFTACLAAIAVIVLPTLPVSAGKGNGKGGGGEDPPPVELMPAPVEYQVTWVGQGRLQDINSAGVALGGHSSPFLADAEGNLWDLAEYFGDALAGYPGWELDSAFNINEAGQVSMVLVPEGSPSGPPVLVAIGEIYADPVPTMTTVAEFPGGVLTSYNDLMDLNEEGDLLLNLRWTGEEPGSFWVYPFPGTGSPWQVAAPTGFASLSGGNLNGAQQVGFSALYETPIRKNRIALTRFAHIGSPDGTLSDFGQIPVNRILWGRQHLWVNESGEAYASAPDGIPSLWSEDDTWEPIVPFLGIVDAISKAESGEEVMVRPHSKGDPLVVYLRGYGAFPIEVTSGLNGAADVDQWNLQTRDDDGPIFRAISRPTSATGTGYLTGAALLLEGSGDRYWSLDSFILTPIPAAP